MTTLNFLQSPRGVCIKCLISFSSISFVVKVHGSQAYRNMEITREHISFTFDPRDVMLSPQNGFSFVRAAVACAILENLWFLSRLLRQLFQVFKACYRSQLLSFYFDLPLDDTDTVCLNLVFPALISILYLVQV